MSTTQTPDNKLARTFSWPEKFLTFKKIMEEIATEDQKQLIKLAEDYIPGLNNMFDNRNVNAYMLEEFDNPMFINELNEAGLLEGKNKIERLTFICNIRTIVRHTWEFTGYDGQRKTGDDLRKALPISWEDDVTLTVEQLVEKVRTM